WNPASGTQVTSFIKTKGMVLSLAFSPSGDTLALGGEDRSVLIVRTSDWGSIKTNYASQSVTAVAFSPNGTMLAAGGLDQNIRLFRTSDWAVDRIVQNIPGGVTALAFSPSGQSLYSGDTIGNIKTWTSVSGWNVANTWTGHVGAVLSLTSAPDDIFLVSGGEDHAIRAWRTADGAPLGVPSQHLGSVSHVSYAPDGLMTASASDDGSIKVWSSQTGLLLHTLHRHTNQVSALAFSSDAKLLASGGGCLDNQIVLWRCSDASVAFSIQAHSNGVAALAFSFDLSLLASGGDRTEQVIKLWNPANGELVRTLPGHTNGIAVLAFSPEGSLLASGGQHRDPTIKLWNLADGSCRTIVAHSGGVRALTFSNSGAWLASAGYKDRYVKVWRTSDASLVCYRMDLARGAESLAFSPDGTLLAGAGSDRIQFWQTAGWQPVGTFTNETSRIRAFSFSPNAAFLLCGREDGTVACWANPWAYPIALNLNVIVSGLQQSPHLTIGNSSFSPYITIQSSSNLVEWLTLTNMMAATNLVHVKDPSLATEPTRFYRVSAPQ
ncbi:MAG TPA: hypothetical protein VEC99_15640, partial [Clostridia bacterium]|nr:hypothetical protein [Clostridia bacterium]